MTELQDRIKELGIVATVERVDENPHLPDWKDAKHWNVKLVRPLPEGRVEMEVVFSTGHGIAGEPETEDVINCLCSDAHSVVNATDFEDFADELGLDSDSRKDERTYNACVKQTDNLRAFLGDWFEPLIYAENE